jgi:Lon protease-like protein
VDIKERSAEAAEAQLERFITQRHEKRVQTEGEREAEEMWMESVARYQERERRQIRAEWCDYHRAAAERARRTLEALISHHEEQAQRLLEPEVPDDAT